MKDVKVNMDYVNCVLLVVILVLVVVCYVQQNKNVEQALVLNNNV